MAAFFTSKRQEVLFLFAILLAFIAFYIETDIYTPSFPEMVDYFSTDEATIQQLVSVNFFGLCCACLFFGPLSDAFGRKPILSFGLGLFMLGSLFCAYTDSLQWMIFNRFLQGVGCGAIVSAGLTTFFDIYPPAQSARLVAFCNGTIGGMMALAPMIGNWINLHWGWRCFKVEGPLDFALTGILSALTAPLAEAGISIFALSTYDTDYLLVKESNLVAAKQVLAKFCHIQESL